MSLHKIKVYVQLIGIGVVFLAVLIFMASNRQDVTVSFLGWEIWSTPLFAFIFTMAGMGIVVFLIGRRVRKVISQVRQLWQEEKKRQQLIEKTKKEVERNAGSS